MNTRVFEVVGKVNVLGKEGKRDFTVLHCVGDPFFSNCKGREVCKCFVDLNAYDVGDLIDVVRIQNNYYVLQMHM